RAQAQDHNTDEGTAHEGTPSVASGEAEDLLEVATSIITAAAEIATAAAEIATAAVAEVAPAVVPAEVAGVLACAAGVVVEVAAGAAATGVGAGVGPGAGPRRRPDARVARAPHAPRVGVTPEEGVVHPHPGRGPEEAAEQRREESAAPAADRGAATDRPAAPAAVGRRRGTVEGTHQADHEPEAGQHRQADADPPKRRPALLLRLLLVRFHPRGDETD